MAAVKLVDFKWILICISRSLNCEVYRFLEKVETLIVKVQSKRKKLLLCGHWNANFLWDSVQLQVLHCLLLSYNFNNTVALPARVTKNISSLIDVMIINKQYNHNSIGVLHLGYSDHFAQILYFLTKLYNKKNYTKKFF